MKVKNLIAILKTLDQEAEVVMQEDDEGNGYRHIRGADEDWEYDADGEVYFLSQYESIESMAEDLEDADLEEELTPVVVVY